MRRQTVVITAAVPSIATEMLSRDFDVIVHPHEGKRTEDELIELLADADGAITQRTDPVTRRVLESNPNLRVVGNFAMGLDNIDLPAARDLNIAVANTPGVQTDATEMARLVATSVRAILLRGI